MSEKEIRTKEEIKSEIAKNKAETSLLDAQAAKERAEASKAEAEVEFALLELGCRKKAHERSLATDSENFVYRFSGDVGRRTVLSCMNKLTEWSRINPKCNIEIIFSSPGGSIIDGFELFDHIQSLRNNGHHITTGTLGMAASMAGILLQAGDVRWVGHQAWVMIHRAAFGAWGKTYEIEDEVEFVKRIEERCLDIFTTRSKLTKQKIKKNWDRKDWWISAEEAKDLGLVDEIRAQMPESKPATKPTKKKAKGRVPKRRSPAK
jgi:ATP-dependent Clp endopeptidase proteolytic subunit ClpP|tara:strand:+ start:374 stop:1162 length:789 start_codon:yes stop_codon:yes gene_type:complete